MKEMEKLPDLMRSTWMLETSNRLPSTLATARAEAAKRQMVLIRVAKCIVSVGWCDDRFVDPDEGEVVLGLRGRSDSQILYNGRVIGLG